jgi:hypothetical protein
VTHVDVSDSQQNLGVRRPSYSNNAFSNNALNAIRRIKGSLLPSRYNLNAITIKPPVVLEKKVSMESQPFVTPQIEVEGGWSTARRDEM